MSLDVIHNSNPVIVMVKSPEHETMKPTRGNFCSARWTREMIRYFFPTLFLLNSPRSGTNVICSHTMIIIGVATCPRKCTTARRGGEKCSTQTFDFQPLSLTPSHKRFKKTFLDLNRLKMGLWAVQKSENILHNKFAKSFEWKEPKIMQVLIEIVQNCQKKA